MLGAKRLRKKSLIIFEIHITFNVESLSRQQNQLAIVGAKMLRKKTFPYFPFLERQQVLLLPVQLYAEHFYIRNA